jgi:hypothetical protein
MAPTDKELGTGWNSGREVDHRLDHHTELIIGGQRVAHVGENGVAIGSTVPRNGRLTVAGHHGPVASGLAYSAARPAYQLSHVRPRALI